jgi:guanylate kinase
MASPPPVSPDSAAPGLLVVLSGPAGVGKSTVGDLLMAAHPEVKRIVTATTRQPRGSERDGVDYHFWTPEKFAAERGAGHLLEWAEVHGNLYGSPAAPAREALASGGIALLIIDVDGADKIRAQNLGALMVFVLPPHSAELERRLRARATEDEARIQKRLARADRELSRAIVYDTQVVNDHAPACAEEVWQAIAARRR